MLFLFKNKTIIKTLLIQSQLHVKVPLTVVMIFSPTSFSVSDFVCTCNMNIYHVNFSANFISFVFIMLLCMFIAALSSFVIYLRG